MHIDGQDAEDFGEVDSDELDGTDLNSQLETSSTHLYDQSFFEFESMSQPVSISREAPPAFITEFKHRILNHAKRQNSLCSPGNIQAKIYQTNSDRLTPPI